MSPKSDATDLTDDELMELMDCFRLIRNEMGGLKAHERFKELAARYSKQCDREGKWNPFRGGQS